MPSSPEGSRGREAPGQGTRTHAIGASRPGQLNWTGVRGPGSRLGDTAGVVGRLSSLDWRYRSRTSLIHVKYGSQSKGGLKKKMEKSLTTLLDYVPIMFTRELWKCTLPQFEMASSLFRPR